MEILLVGNNTLGVGLAETQEVADDRGEFMGGGGNGLGCSQFGAHATVELAQAGLATMERRGGQAQGQSGAVLHVARPNREDLTFADAVIWA